MCHVQNMTIRTGLRGAEIRRVSYTEHDYTTGLRGAEVRLVSCTEHDYMYWAARCRDQTCVIYGTWLYILGCEVQR